MFLITTRECIYVEVVFVWFLRHAFSSVTKPHTNNRWAGVELRPRRRRKKMEGFWKQLLVSSNQKSTTSDCRRSRSSSKWFLNVVLCDSWESSEKKVKVMFTFSRLGCALKFNPLHNRFHIPLSFCSFYITFHWMKENKKHFPLTVYFTMHSLSDSVVDNDKAGRHRE